MTYAIIESGNKQYWVKQGDEILVEKLPQIDGSIEFPEVLLVSNGEGQVQVGKPYVPGVSVKATVLGLKKGEKLIAFKYKNKTGHHKTIGHRQLYTLIKVEAIAGV